MTQAQSSRAQGSAVSLFRLDEPDGAVDEVDAIQAEIAAHVVHEREQPVARHIELGDHFAATHRGAEAVIQRAVVVLEVQIQLVRVAPVELAVGGEIEVGESLGTPRCLSRCASVSSSFQSRCDRRRWSSRNRPVVLHGPIARQHAGAQEIGALRRGGELKIAVQVAGGDALVEGVDELLDLEPRDAALHLDAGHQPQGHRRDHAKQSVAADHVAEQLGVVLAVAAHEVAGGRHHFEALHVGHERPGGETAAVNVGGDRAAQGQPVRAGLLLANAKGRPRTALQCEIAPDQVRPGDAGFGFELRRAAVEPAHAG